jgi:hypothetical protein
MTYITKHQQVSITCERARCTHFFDISMTSEEPELHEVLIMPDGIRLVCATLTLFAG